MKKKDRVFNIRFLFCVFVGLMMGIVIGKLFVTRKISIWLTVGILILAIAVSILSWIYASKMEESNKKSRARRKTSTILKCSSVGFLIAVVAGMISIISPMLSMMSMPNIEYDTVITGVVGEYVVSEETYKKFVLTDCEIIENDGRKSLGYDVLIYTENYADISLGDRITFAENLTKYTISDEYGIHSLINNIGYSAYISVDDMILSEGKMSIRDWIHNRVYSVLMDNLNEENANISYAILFGDKNGLDEGVSQMFSYAGISHILAVSGLHVSVLVSIIWFLLDKIKCKKYIKLGVFGGILLFYAYLCYFSPSVCRAGVMAFTLATCKAFKVEYDSLSSLSLAGIIILALSPEKLFSLSFQLSFMCIFSIITLAPAFDWLFDKIRCPKWLGSALGMSIATNIAVLPVSVNVFGEVSLLGVISNIFVLPIFSVVYVLLFTVVLFSVIIKPLGVFLFLPDIFLHLIKVVATYVGMIPFGVFRIFNVSYWLLALIVLASLLVHFLMAKNYIKLVAVSSVVIMICVVFGLNLIPTSYTNDILVAKQNNTGVVVVSDENSTILVGSDITNKSLMLMLKKMRLNRIDEILAYDLQLNELKELQKVCNTFGVNKVYIPSKYNTKTIVDMFPNTTVIVGGEKICDYTLGIIEDDGDLIAIRLIRDDKIVLIPRLENNKHANSIVSVMYVDSADYLLVERDSFWTKLEGYEGIKHYFDEEEIIIKG